MDNAYYMPNELPTTVNYPELGVRKADIQTVINYATTAQNAINDYNTGITDKIDLNQDEIQSNIDLCRDVCNTLGTATNACFDILTQLRMIQKLLQSLIYFKNQYGNQYVGKPTTTTDGGGL